LVFASWPPAARLAIPVTLAALASSPASHAAYSVGYESVPQFTREYGRLFGLSPVKHIRAAKDGLRAVA
jgi:AraC-like DNA-binding protein